jgi:AraC-like DNA-binding protein
MGCEERFRIRWASWVSLKKVHHLPRDHYTLVAVFSGHLKLESYKFGIGLEEGQMAVIPSGFGHQEEIFLSGRAERILEVGFTAEGLMGSTEPFSRLPLPKIVRILDLEKSNRAADQITAFFRDQGGKEARVGARPWLDGLLWGYLQEGFAQGFFSLFPRKAPQEWMQAIPTLLGQCGLRKGMTLSQLASRLGVSLVRFKQGFREYYGVPPGTYLRRVKLRLAAEMLRSNPELSIQELAKRCGYANLSCFDQAFRRAFGSSPSQYRRAGFEGPAGSAM